MMLMLRGKGSAWWLPALANETPITGGPTLDEMALGQSLTAGVTDIQGLSPQRNKISVPIMKHKTEAQIDGPAQYQTVLLGLAEEDGTGTDDDALERVAALAALAEGSDGYLVLSRRKQTLEAGDAIRWIKAHIDDQDELWDLSATYERTDVHLSPSSPVVRGVVLAGS